MALEEKWVIHFLQQTIKQELTNLRVTPSLTNNVNYLYLQGNQEGDAESYNTTVYGSYTYLPGRWGIRYDDNNVAPDEHIWKVCYKGTDEGENGKPYYEITNTQWLTEVHLGRSIDGYVDSSLPVEQNGPWRSLVSLY